MKMMTKKRKLPTTFALAASAAVAVFVAGSDARAEAPQSGSAVSSGASPAAEREPPESPEHFRIGVLGGVGFPRPLAIEGLMKIERRIALGVEYSVMPVMTFSGVRTTLWALAGDLRIFPFGNAFFLGARVGHQHFGGSASATVASYGTINESITVDTLFVNPRIGVLWTSSAGLTFGIDAGVQVPMTSSTSSTLPNGLTATNDVNTVAGTIGRSALPTIDLFRLGFLF